MKYTDRISKSTILAGIIFLTFAVPTSTASGSGQQPGAPNCCDIVNQVVSAVGQIKPDSPRAEIEKAFQPDGGIFSRERTVYVYRRCHSIKIVVDFALDKSINAFAAGAPTDRVISISKPYLEYPVSD